MESVLRYVDVIQHKLSEVLKNHWNGKYRELATTELELDECGPKAGQLMCRHHVVDVGKEGEVE